MCAALMVSGCAGYGTREAYHDGSARDAKGPGDIGRAGSVVVERGDTLYAIARRSGVTVDELLALNRLDPPYTIYPGQRIRLPKPSVHVVRTGETVHALAERYGIGMGALVRANDIEPPYLIHPGQRLSVPDGEAQAAARRDGPPETPRARPTELRSVSLGPPPPRAAGRFLWPVRGPVLVGFGPHKGGLRNDGINILAEKGALVRAAENGVVAYSGNEIKGFGNLILIKHAEGWMSAYAHNDELLVKAGDEVRRGQSISRVGNSGSVVRPQLHFELRRGRRVVDPLRYLAPAEQAISAVLPAASRAGPPSPG